MPLMNENEIIECYSISGEFDFMLKVVAKHGFSYDFHVNKLSQIENRKCAKCFADGRLKIRCNWWY
jgi:DNA-binding Lrp family transcriptional regulator